MVRCLPALVFLALNLNVIKCPQQSKPLNTLPNHPILLVVLDGFQGDRLNEFLALYPDSALGRIQQNGAKASYVLPALHYLDFRNLMTLATGMRISGDIDANTVACGI
jgi:hypothetical protein